MGLYFQLHKEIQERGDLILLDRALVTIDRAFLAAYVELSIKTCHRRKAHSIGGMSAYMPVKDEEANRVAMEKVSLDKEREVKAGARWNLGSPPGSGATRQRNLRGDEWPASDFQKEG